MKKLNLSILLSPILFTASVVSAQSVYQILNSNLCDGYPQVSVGTIQGSCLGLVADQKLKDSRTNEGFLFPRKIVELTSKRYLVLDMGGWSPRNRGALWELDLQSKPAKLWKLMGKLTLPHGLAWGPDGSLYIGEAHQISRLSKEALLNRQSLQLEVVIRDLEIPGKNLHPLINFTFGQGSHDFGDLYVNMGAPSDACIDEAPYRCAVGNQQGLIRRYRYQSGINRWESEFKVWASGLRNSMGLVSHPSGNLLQVENSRDFKDDNEPYDELNWVQDGQHYGWPYCYNFQATSPEWKGKVNCEKGYQKPLLLLPPHAAPLDVIYYTGSMFPELQNHLLISWHGYKPTGSRIVAYPVNAKGLPFYEQAESWSYSTGASRQVAKPQGGNLRVAAYLELISDWQKREGVRPLGAPVGLLVASDGAIIIVEDKNKSIVRLAKISKSDSNDKSDSGAGGVGAGASSDEDWELKKRANVYLALKSLNSNPEYLKAYNWINQNVFQSSCVGCHSQLKGNDTQAFEYMVGESWIETGKSNSLILQRLRGQNGYQKMPLGSELPESVIEYIEKWIVGL